MTALATEDISPKPKGIFSIWHGLKFCLHSTFETFLGWLSMMVILAIVAVIPILNVISLGYLLEMSTRVSQSGRFRDGMMGFKKAAMIGRILLSSYLCLLPTQLLLELQHAAELTDPQGENHHFFIVLTRVVLFITLFHILWACIRGAKFRHFLWPAPLGFWKWLKEPHSFIPPIRSWLKKLPLALIRDHFILGLKAFIGSILWLILPIGIMIFASFLPPGGQVLSIPAGFAFMYVILHLPFLQIHLAREKSFKAIFQLKKVRADFKKAPLLSWLALFITLLFATPLYLLKIELTPKEIAWLPSLFFVIFIYPARLFTGWVIFKTKQKEQDSHVIFRWMGKLAVIPILIAYLILVFIAQYLSWNGAFSLLEQHAFLVPAPMLSL